ncbi:MAG TPA: hypothetical protein VHE23_07480 [Candidatus Acidoferrales bacterium]|nr:hypothetical protein [Candidatus Acidoferrales bacterium]
MHRKTSLLCCSCLVAVFFLWCTRAGAHDPKPTPENTIQIHLAEPVKPQPFPRPVKFFIGNVIDRSGNPQPLLVLKDRGGVFLDRQPTEIAREALMVSLHSADALATDQDSADLVVNIYLFKFGLAAGSGIDFFGKVEFTAVIKNPKTGESKEVKATGTSIAGRAVFKKNIQKNVQEDIGAALSDALRNFLRGTALRDAVAALTLPAAPSAAAASQPPPGFSPGLMRPRFR